MRSSISNNLKTFWSWWTIDNWKDAVDLALKLSTIFAIFTAANIFILKPSFYIEATIEGKIDNEKLKEMFRENNMAISSTIQEYMERFNQTSSISDTKLFYAGNYNPEASPQEITYFLNDELGLIWETMSIRFLPEPLDGTSYTEEEIFYVKAYHDSSYAIISFKVQNQTGGTLKDVQIFPPNNFELINGNDKKIDLAPNQEIINTYRTKDLQHPSNNIYILYDTSSSSLVNSTALNNIGYLMLVIWIVTILVSIVYKIKYPLPSDDIVIKQEQRQEKNSVQKQRKK
jgi:hypothetical protein